MRYGSSPYLMLKQGLHVPDRPCRKKAALPDAEWLGEGVHRHCTFTLSQGPQVGRNKASEEAEEALEGGGGTEGGGSACRAQIVNAQLHTS